MPGGGVALLRAKRAVSTLKSDIDDVQAGINIVLKALEAPIRQIAENAGVEGSIVVGKINDSKSQTFGFNAQSEQYVDMIEAGIIDPAKVVRHALQDAASVASLLITTEAMIADRPKGMASSGRPSVADAAIGPSPVYRPYRSHGSVATTPSMAADHADYGGGGPPPFSGDVSLPGEPDVPPPKRPPRGAGRSS